MTTLEERMAQLTPERRAKIEARTDELHQEYLALRTLRKKLNLTQGEIAERLGVKQSSISKLENGDRRLTLEILSDVIAALGGEWEINVKLPGTKAMRLIGSEEFQHPVSQSKKLRGQHTMPRSTREETEKTDRKKSKAKAC
ncbi:MAG: helix-turn-helix transcriptional regulator [Acaryochloridaceae cyanobacterium RU_4_10]|nr:helix-turn-helix transcriptional regulator [Acaryochloridaceae cyanobacterium RU_4_10]